MKRIHPWLPLISLAIVLLVCIAEYWLLGQRQVARRRRPATIAPERFITLDSPAPAPDSTAWLEQFGVVLDVDGVQRGLTALVRDDDRPENVRMVTQEVRRMSNLIQLGRTSPAELRKVEEALARVLVEMVAALDDDQRELLHEFRDTVRDRTNQRTTLSVLREQVGK